MYCVVYWLCGGNYWMRNGLAGILGLKEIFGMTFIEWRMCWMTFIECECVTIMKYDSKFSMKLI